MTRRIQLAITTSILAASLLACGLPNAGPTADKKLSDKDSKTGPKGPTATQKPTVTLDMEVKLWEAYGDNVIAAERKYTGALVELKLVRGKIEKDDSGRYCIVDYCVEPPPPGTTPALYCYVAPASLEKLERVKLGEAFHLRGKCLGRMNDPSAWQGYRVTLENCEVLAILEYKGSSWIEKR